MILAFIRNLFFIVLLCQIAYYAQQTTLPLSIELYLQCSNPDNENISILLEAQSKVWDETNFISTDPNLLFSSILFDKNYFGSSKGWDIVHSRTSGEQVFGYGLYKIFTNHSNTHFFLNYLDCRTKNDFGIDITIKYVAESENFYYQIGAPSNSTFNQIENEQILNIWSLKNQGLPTTSCLEDFWQNCLVAIPEESSDNYYTPHLVWGPIPDFNATSYKIYRAIGNSAGLSIGNYSLISTTSADVFEYTDEEIDLSDNQYVFYYVAAYNSAINKYSEASNVITTRAGMYKQAIENAENQETASKFKLEENYPNPFNPSTTISFVIPNEVRNLKDTRSTEYYSVLQNVTLKVYDVLGREVATLVNEQKPAGNYEVNFDVSDLSSGIYFYRLRAGSFAQTRKMILLR